jgi:hypothetical protein
MCELLKIRQQLESTGYRDTESLFELRILIMNTASWLASQHIAILRLKKDLSASQMLVAAFSSMKTHYRSLETVSTEHEQCFDQVKNIVLTDITELYTKLEGQHTKILQLRPESIASLRVAK